MTEYTSEERRLAHELSATLKDPEALPLYLQYCRRYQEAFLRKKLAQAMSVDESKIRRSRGALFTFLVNQHNNGSTRH